MRMWLNIWRWTDVRWTCDAAPVKRTLLFSFVVLLSGSVCSTSAQDSTGTPNPAPAPAAEPSAGLEPPGVEVPSLAALGLPNAKEPMPGVLTGGVPTEEDLKAAKSLGVTTVVSLLPDADAERTQVEALGMTFVSIPVASPADLTEDNARQLGEAMSSHDKPMIVHCASGNRVGALMALEAFYVEGMSRDEALKRGEDAGLTSLRGDVETRLDATETTP